MTRRPASARVENLEERRLLSSGIFSAPMTYANISKGNTVAVADLNGDGIPDLVEGTVGNVSIFLGNGNGTFAFEKAFSTSTSLYADTDAIAIGDVNGDGIPDIIADNIGVNSFNPYAASNVAVLIGNGDGTFKAPITYADGAAPYSDSIALGDFNHDGKLDVAISSNPKSKVYSVNVLMNNGDGTFGAPTTYATGNNPFYVAAADVNGDGLPDLVVADEGGAEALGGSLSQGAVSVLLNLGNGTFGPQATYATGAGTAVVTVADVNGDGIPDIIATNEATAIYYNGSRSSGSTVSVLLGEGGGIFHPEVTYAVGVRPVAINVADINGDGFPDLVVGNLGSSYVSLLVNNGDGTFQAQTTVSTGGTAYALKLADLNADGKPDLVALDVSQFSSSLAVLFNQAAPTSRFATLANGVLTIIGTTSADTISVTDTDRQVSASLNGTTEGPFIDVTGLDVLPGASNDTVSLAGVPINATVGGAGGNDSITGGAGNDFLKGGKGDDTIGGAGGNDTMVGGGGNDCLKGGGGNDSLAGGPGNDILHGGDGNDMLYGGIGNDTVNGNAGNDTVTAGSGSSALFAGPGNDSIIGSTTAGYMPDSIYCGGSTDTILAGTDDSIFDSVQGDSISGGHIVS